MTLNPTPVQPEERASLATRLALKQRAGGIIVPLVTVVVAILISAVVVAATGGHGFSGRIDHAAAAYRDIFRGAGLNWVFHPTTSTNGAAAYNLSQTLLETTTLILTGLAVAFAFRCGLFNIGGQGQYFVGLFTAVWIGSSLPHMARLWHVLIAICAAALAGALWAGIAPFLKGDDRGS